MEPLRFFDANVMAGRPRRPPDPVPWETRPLGDLLDEFGIAEALVWHIESKEVEPNWGNDRLLDLPGDHARLHGAWAALPHHTGETPAPREFCIFMGSHGVRAAILFPKTHNWSLEDWCAGPLLAEFEARRVPVLLDQDETSWPEIARVLAAHPDLRLILIGGTYRNSRYLFPLLTRYQHLYLEVSGFQAHRLIETMVRAGLIGRLLFGSRMPLYTPGSALAAVVYADISEHERRAIAGDTLRGLLAEADV